jgi:hypothetical protein
MLTDFESHVLGPLEVLHKSKTVGLLVTPDALETLPVTEGAKSVLPVPLSTESKTLEHVTTGESNAGLDPRSVIGYNNEKHIEHTGFISSNASAMSIRRPFLRPL